MNKQASESATTCSYVCVTFFHVYVSLIKAFEKPNREHRFFLLNIYPELWGIRERLTKLHVVASVELIDESGCLHKWYKSNGISRRFGLIRHLEKSFKSIDLRPNSLAYIFYPDNLFGLYVTSKISECTLYEDGKKSKFLLGFRPPDLVAKLKARFGLWLLGGGYAKSIKRIECTSMEQIPEGLRFKFLKTSLPVVEKNLSDEQVRMLRSVFLEESKAIHKVARGVLLLTSPIHIMGWVASLDAQIEVYRRIIDHHCKDGEMIFIKPHPGDLANYCHDTLGRRVYVFEKLVPFEMFKHLQLRFSKYLTLASTAMEGEPDESLSVAVPYSFDSGGKLILVDVEADKGIYRSIDGALESC